MQQIWLAACLGMVLMGCGSGRSGGDGGRGDGGSVDDGSGDGAGVGEVCQAGAMSDAEAHPCRPGLVCCYPCGIPDCDYRCTVPCMPGPGCMAGSGCPGPFP